MATKHSLNPRSAGAALLALAAALTSHAPAFARDHHDVTRAALEPGKIRHIVVIDLENEDFDYSFGPSSPATYLNNVLVKQGQLIENYYATSHASMGNYVSQISGQASTQAQNNDCIDLTTLVPPFANILGSFTAIAPATPTADDQVIGDGCVFPAFVKTIADQLDAKYGHGRDDKRGDDDRAHDDDYVYPWRAYAEDMGNLPSRDYGTPLFTGGTACAHPPIGGPDYSNSAVPGDGYATRHNPFMYFRSIIDDATRCNERVVPLGTVTIDPNGGPDTFVGALANDLKHKRTTPAFAFIIPDLCNDGHDGTCKPADVGGTATDIEGGNAGGLAAADLWLKHWIPLLMDSPAYRDGEMLIVVTFDEGGITPAGSAACCAQPVGPNQNGNPGYATLLGLFGFPAPSAAGQYPGGGKTGAVLLNRKYIEPGVVNATGEYNHYSALRSYEDLLGLTTGGTDGYGHLGYAGKAGLTPFGEDVFNRKR
jgi:hypothetical protein